MNTPTENTWSDVSRRAAAQARRNKAQVGSRVRTPHGKGHISRLIAGLHKLSPTTISVVMDSLKERHYQVLPDDHSSVEVLKTDGGKKWKKKLRKIA